MVQQMLRGVRHLNVWRFMCVHSTHDVLTASAPNMMHKCSHRLPMMATSWNYIPKLTTHAIDQWCVIFKDPDNNPQNTRKILSPPRRLRPP